MDDMNPVAPAMPPADEPMVVTADEPMAPEAMPAADAPAAM